MKSEASYLSLTAINRNFLESPKFKEEQPEPSIEILMPPEVLITDNMETFPEIPKELAENFIIDFPVNLELSNYIIFMPSDILKKEFNGCFIELPVLLRNMWNNVIYSKDGSDAIRPESKYLKSGKHGVKWKEGSATAKNLNKPQGQWSLKDLEFASEKAGTLRPGEYAEFNLQDGSTSVVHLPNGTTVPATKIWIRNNGTGTFHGYPKQ